MLTGDRRRYFAVYHAAVKGLAASGPQQSGAWSIQGLAYRQHPRGNGQEYATMCVLS